MLCCFCFQAEDGIRDLVRSRGLGDVYKRQQQGVGAVWGQSLFPEEVRVAGGHDAFARQQTGMACLLYTSDAADERSSVDLGGRRIIKKKKHVRSARHVRTNNK